MVFFPYIKALFYKRFSISFVLTILKFVLVGKGKDSGGLPNCHLHFLLNKKAGHAKRDKRDGTNQPFKHA